MPTTVKLYRIRVYDSETDDFAEFDSPTLPRLGDRFEPEAEDQGKVVELSDGVHLENNVMGPCFCVDESDLDLNAEHALRRVSATGHGVRILESFGLAETREEQPTDDPIDLL